MTGALRFCMFSTFYPPYSYGGDGITLQRLCRALVRAGHDVTVVHDADAYTSSGYPQPTAVPSDDGVEVVTLRSSLGMLSVLLTHQLGRPVVHGGEIAHVARNGATSTSCIFTTCRSSAARDCLRSPAIRPPCTRRTNTGSSARPTCSGVIGENDARGVSVFGARSGYRRPPQLWRSTGLLERSLHDVDTFIALSEFSRDKHREFGFPRDMEVLAAHRVRLPMPARSTRRLRARTHGRTSSMPDDSSASRVWTTSYRSSETRTLPLTSLIAGAGAHEPVLRALAGDSPRIQFLGHLPPQNARAAVSPRDRAHRAVCLLRDVRQYARRGVSTEHARRGETNRPVSGNRHPGEWWRAVRRCR